MSGSTARETQRGLGAVAAVTAVVAAAMLGPVAGEQPLDASFEHVGVWLALCFLGCEWFGLRAEREHGEQYGFTLSLVPMAAGLVFAAPLVLLASRLVGVIVPLLVTRQRRALEAAYEVAVHALQVGVAVVVFHVVLGSAGPDTAHGAAALAVALAASFASAGLVLVVCITAVARTWLGLGHVVAIARSGAIAATVNGVVGVAAAWLLFSLPSTVVVAGGIVLAGLACSVAYRGLLHRHRKLQTHYSFVSSVVRSTDLTEITSSVLTAARALFGADDVVLLLRPAGPDESARRLRHGSSGDGVVEVSPIAHLDHLKALMPQAKPQFVTVDDSSPGWLRSLGAYATLVAPLTSTERAVVGALVVTQDRRKVLATFGDADAVLLGTLAEQASIAIENGMLFHRLEREAEDRAHQAMHDPLTGLPNRARLHDLVAGALEAAHTSRRRVGLLVVDVDSFSQVVDAFGHDSADGLLVQACGRIRGLLPEDAILARLGGEQFAIVLPELDESDEAVRVARLLIAGFDPPFQAEGVLLALGVNVGIAVYPEQAIDVPSLVQRSHIAADTAAGRRSGWELYDPGDDPVTPRRLALAADLREALELDRLDVCFQPKVELATGIVRGAEALVRWNHPRLGRVRPDEFIAIAEHTGDIRALTLTVMRKALAECRAWRELGLDLGVAVNLSARNLLDLHLVDDVSAAIEEAGVPSHALTLELTESVVMSESSRSVDVLGGLSALGVRLSCDDFGTGYSSLAHLRRLPIGEVKIDKSFISRMAVDASDRAIARSVLALGKDLGLQTVAEGVESREGWELLTELGCDLAQGFVVCPPLTSRQFGEWLGRRPPTEFAYLDERYAADLASYLAAVSDDGDGSTQVVSASDDPSDDTASGDPASHEPATGAGPARVPEVAPPGEPTEPDRTDADVVVAVGAGGPPSAVVDHVVGDGEGASAEGPHAGDDQTSGQG